MKLKTLIKIATFKKLASANALYKVSAMLDEIQKELNLIETN